MVPDTVPLHVIIITSLGILVLPSLYCTIHLFLFSLTVLTLTDLLTLLAPLVVPDTRYTIHDT